jgi:hypothetical protein
MSTKYIMIASAAFLGLLGAASQFLPAEILVYFNVEANTLNEMIIQLAGALYLGFAMLNWMGKSNIIGGVYSRPVSMGNFLHFLIGAITLANVLFAGNNGTAIIVITILYSLFALAFAKIVFFHPVKAITKG